jgi:hypothetical protein
MIVNCFRLFIYFFMWIIFQFSTFMDIIFLNVHFWISLFWSLICPTLIEITWHAFWVWLSWVLSDSPPNHICYLSGSIHCKKSQPSLLQYSFSHFALSKVKLAMMFSVLEVRCMYSLKILVIKFVKALTYIAFGIFFVHVFNLSQLPCSS